MNKKSKINPRCVGALIVVVVICLLVAYLIFEARLREVI